MARALLTLCLAEILHSREQSPDNQAVFRCYCFCLEAQLTVTWYNPSFSSNKKYTDLLNSFKYFLLIFGCFIRVFFSRVVILQSYFVCPTHCIWRLSFCFRYVIATGFLFLFLLNMKPALSTLSIYFWEHHISSKNVLKGGTLISSSFFFKCLMKCCKYFCSRRAFYFGNINLECHKKLWKVYFIPTLNLAHRSWLSRE